MTNCITTSSRNARHVLAALLHYRSKIVGEATGIELQQFDEMIDDFLDALRSARYNEDKKEQKESQCCGER